jgi:hypothetical protein
MLSAASLARSASVCRFSSLGCFPGTQLPFVPSMVFRDPHDNAPIPCFRSTKSLPSIPAPATALTVPFPQLLTKTETLWKAPRTRS